MQKKHSTDPYVQLYHIEEHFIDNAPEAIQDLISEVQACHFDYYTIDNLEQMTREIKERQLSYIRDAIYYYEILTKKLYKARYSSFNDYCQRELGFTAWRCKQVIEAGGVALKLLAAGHTKLPQNCSQAYALSRLNDEELIEKWEQIISTYPMHQLSAEKIKEILYPPEKSSVERGATIAVMPVVSEYLSLNAYNLGISVSDYLLHLIKLQKCKFSLLLNIVNFCT